MTSLSSQMNRRLTNSPAKQEPQHQYAVSNRKSEMDSVQSPRKTKTNRRAGGRRPSMINFTSLSSYHESSHRVNKPSIPTSSHVEAPADKPTRLHTSPDEDDDSPTSEIDFLFEVHLRREKSNRSLGRDKSNEKLHDVTLSALIEALAITTEDW
jgi:hypothetical protein